MEWLIYLSKVSACMALFYVFYHFFLQKLTFFSINRAYLLLTLLLSFLIPLLQLEIVRPAPEAEKIIQADVLRQNVSEPLAAIRYFSKAAPVAEASEVSGTNWRQLMPAAYWLLSGAGLALFFYRLAVLAWYSRRVSERAGVLKLVDKAGGFTDCSFFNYVFIDRNKSRQELEAMLQHERVHALKLHSLDKMLVSLSKSILWFNPFIFLYSRALEQVHEYEADQETSRVVGNTAYASLLLSLAATSNNTPLVHSFVKNPVKERIKMLFTNPSKNRRKLTYLPLVPAGLALVWLFGVQVVYAEKNAKTEIKTAGIAKREVQTVAPAPEVSTGIPGRVISNQSLPETKEGPEVPPRLIDNVELGENPLVFIDGKEYPAEILTRISPACMSSARFSYGKAEIFTWKNQITYATRAEIETAKIRRKIKAQGKFYSRYPVTINGHKRDEILVRFGDVFADASFPAAYRIALSLDGKIFSEKQALKMTGNEAYGMTGIAYRYTKDDPELLSKYGGQYDLILEFKNENASETKQSPGLTRGSSTVISESGDEKFVYSAKDSVALSQDKRYLTLFGNAKIVNGRRSTLSGDKIRFDAKKRTAIVQNGIIMLQGKKEAIEGRLLQVNIDNGTYEILSGTPDF